MRKQTLAWLSSAVILLTFITLFPYRQAATNTRAQKSEVEVKGARSEADVVVSYGNGDLTSASLVISEGETAFSVLEELAYLEDLDLQTTRYDFGIFINSIDGFVSSSDESWIYFVNGEGGNVAADQYLLEPGDFVEWKFIDLSEQAGE